MTFYNLSHFLASALLWVLFGIIPSRTFVLYIRSVRDQNQTRRIFWTFLASFMESMSFQPVFELRVRSAYQNFLQMLFFLRLIDIFDLEAYIAQVEVIVDGLLLITQQFPPIENNFEGNVIDV